MGSTTATKRVVITLHVICAILALVIVSFGIYLACTYTKTTVDVMASYSYIIIGASTLVVLLLGCFSAVRENVCCTVTFIVLIIIVIIGQVIVVFLLTAGQGAVSSNFANVLDDTWEEELKSQGAMSLYENWLKCCGRASPQDYIVNDRFPPTTCFKNGNISRTEDLIENGCRIEFENYCQNLLLIFNMLCWVLIGFELIGTIISCCLCNFIRNDRRRSYF